MEVNSIKINTAYPMFLKRTINFSIFVCILMEMMEKSDSQFIPLLLARCAPKVFD